MASENINSNAKPDKPVKQEKPVKLDKNGKPKKTIGQKLKGLFGELKKVTWPTPAKVAQKTGVVLVVSLVFLLLLMGMDVGLGALYDLLTGGLGSSSALTFSQSVIGTGGNTISVLSQLPKIM